jgi:hypothetical protein
MCRLIVARRCRCETTACEEREAGDTVATPSPFLAVVTRLKEIYTIVSRTARCARNHERNQPRFVASLTFPLAAPQGDERARPAKRAAAEATLRALDSSHVTTTSERRVPEVSLHHPPGARSSRPVRHAPPTLARSAHRVVCHVLIAEPHDRRTEWDIDRGRADRT